MVEPLQEKLACMAVNILQWRKVVPHAQVMCHLYKQAPCSHI